eukprot:7484536-Lingulodinium_polyedra.AAC.1
MAQAQVHRKLLSAQYIEAARDSWYDSVVSDVSCGCFPGKGSSFYVHDLSNPVRWPVIDDCIMR